MLSVKIIQIEDYADYCIRLACFIIEMILQVDQHV